MTDPRLTCPICMHREAGLIPAPRHVPAWDDLTGPEQMTMLAEVGAALGRGAAGFVAAFVHDHFHLREASGARLTTGGRDPLLPLLAERLDTAQSVDLAIAFAMDSGVTLDEGESSTLSPEAFAEFQRATDAPGTRIRGLARAAEKAQGLLKEAD
ncbi:hypothetical protein [Algicella marina]|uniref:hypothetical protein n=1 Tax=Algicella marina TaxID=2683284 RepID=UPI0024DFE1FB|nr:hypothetical protein [Algicella marina]